MIPYEFVWFMSCWVKKGPVRQTLKNTINIEMTEQGKVSETKVTEHDKNRNDRNMINNAHYKSTEMSKSNLQLSH